jgi:lipopolysaccharide/colanic/teichoic acid biosynthesis glycosyltransferase
MSVKTSDLTSVSEAEKAVKMFEVLADQKFDHSASLHRLYSTEKIRLSLTIWAIRIKVLGMLKRALDLAVSLLVLPFLMPIMLIAAIAIKIDSPGPILFKQTRVGKWGRLFTCYKFRSMFIDAEARKAELMHLNEADAIVFKIAKDPRITRVGRIIRKLSIDEFPQLFNVIKGDMSWVGPRPPIPYEVENYEYDHRRRLLAVPGITGLQQVSGRSTVSFNRWVELDLQYIQEQSLAKDLEILIKTIPAVISGKGAY